MSRLESTKQRRIRFLPLACRLYVSAKGPHPAAARRRLEAPGKSAIRADFPFAVLETPPLAPTSDYSTMSGKVRCRQRPQIADRLRSWRPHTQRFSCGKPGYPLNSRKSLFSLHLLGIPMNHRWTNVAQKSDSPATQDSNRACEQPKLGFVRFQPNEYGWRGHCVNVLPFWIAYNALSQSGSVFRIFAMALASIPSAVLLSFAFGSTRVWRVFFVLLWTAYILVL